ncbi:MAG: efflux RND transporter periplasmic adaptor subunit [Lachnospiraceae bacterium]|nr:efflux RND transporter periplasmic adaptor subunit [Lachnospiraceae bacterium]
MRTGNRMIRRYGALFLTAVLGTSSLSGCAPFGKNSEAEALSAEEAGIVLDVETISPERRSVAISSNFSATVEADSTVTVIPKLSGEVTQKNFEVGDHVNEGDLLFTIDDKSAQIALKQAQATLTSAQAGLTAQTAATASAHAQGLQTIGTISTTEKQLDYAVEQARVGKMQAKYAYESAQYQAENAEDQLKIAEDNLDNAKDAKKKAKDTRDDLRSLQNEYRRRARTDKTAADTWLAGRGYASAASLSSAVTSAESAYTSAKNSQEQLENNMDILERNIRIAENSAGSAELNYYIGGEGIELAEKQYEDYELYGINSTLYGVNASVVGADSSLTNSEASVKQAKAGLENAQMNLGYTKVSAPVSGTITEINVSLHNMTSPSVEAYVIQSDARNKITFYVAEETRANLAVGNSAIVIKNGAEYNATITLVSDTLDSSTGLFKVEAVLDDDVDTLVNGSDVSIRTVTRESKDALVLPMDCVYYEGEQAFVYVNEGNKAIRRNVSTGISDDRGVEISEGISADDEIVSTWSAQLKDGAEIKVAGTGPKGNGDSAESTESTAALDDAAKDKDIRDVALARAGAAMVESTEAGVR